MDKRKIKCLFFSLSFCVRFLSLFFYFPSCVSFFLSTFLFIYFDAYENFPSVSENFHLFSVFKLLIKIFPYQPKFPLNLFRAFKHFLHPWNKLRFCNKVQKKISMYSFGFANLLFYFIIFFEGSLDIFHAPWN